MKVKEKKLVRLVLYNEEKIFAPRQFKEDSNKDLLEAWLSKSLIPQWEPGDAINFE